jgi:hypothetical protein
LISKKSFDEQTAILVTNYSKGSSASIVYPNAATRVTPITALTARGAGMSIHKANASSPKVVANVALVVARVVGLASDEISSATGTIPSVRISIAVVAIFNANAIDAN